MAFWRTWSWDASSIDKLLENDDVTLEQLLRDDEILSEVKAQNKKLVEFLALPNNLEQVISYVVDEHNELPQDTQYRYSYLCYEILCSDLFPVCEVIFSQTEFLDRIFNFWYKDPPLNHHLSGYVFRISSFLLNKRKLEVIGFLKQKENFVRTLLSHVYSSAVVELFVKLVACEDQDTSTASWLASQGVTKFLVDKMNSEESELIHEHVGQILANVIVISLQSASMGGDYVLLRQLEEENTIRTLFSYIFANSQSSALLHGSIVLVELIRKNSAETYDSATTVDTLPMVLQVILEYLPKMNEFLLNDVSSELNTTMGRITPLGPYRMKIVELFGMLISTRYCCIFEEILKTSLFSTCFDLFFNLPWNNFLHTIVFRAFQIILECEESEIVQKLIEVSNAPSRFAKAGLAASKLPENTSRPGYMGFVNSLTSRLIRIEEIQEHLEKVEQWNEYIDSDYSTMLNLESKPLGGPLRADSSDDEDNPIEQITTFQTLVKRSFENEFPDDFAVGNLDDPVLDSLLHPPLGTNFLGVVGSDDFGNEFEDD